MDLGKYLEDCQFNLRRTLVHLRLHLDEPTKEFLLEYFKDFDIVLIAEEFGIRKHFHVLLGDEDFDKFGKNLDILRKRVKEKFKLKSNKDYSLSLVKNIQKICSYIMKDSKYVCQGIPQHVLDLFGKLSYKKFEKGKFKLALEDYRTVYMSTYMETYELLSGLIELKLSYNQVLNLPQLHNIAITWIVQKDRKKLNQLIENSVREINNKFWNFSEN